MTTFLRSRRKPGTPRPLKVIQVDGRWIDVVYELLDVTTLDDPADQLRLLVGRPIAAFEQLPDGSHGTEVPLSELGSLSAWGEP